MGYGAGHELRVNEISSSYYIRCVWTGPMHKRSIGTDPLTGYCSRDSQEPNSVSKEQWFSVHSFRVPGDFGVSITTANNKNQPCLINQWVQWRTCVSQGSYDGWYIQSQLLVEGNPEEFVGGRSILAELFQTEPVVDWKESCRCRPRRVEQRGQNHRPGKPWYTSCLQAQVPRSEPPRLNAVLWLWLSYSVSSKGGWR